MRNGDTVRLTELPPPGPVLPYDAEVEYLQGDGSCYVVLDEDIDINFSASLRIYVTAVSGQALMAGFFGKRNGNSSGCRLRQTGDSLIWGDPGGSPVQATVAASRNTWHDITLTRTSISVDGGEPVAIGPRGSSYSPIYISATDTGRIAGNCRFGPMKIHTSTADYDLLPVRVGSEGRFYDRISQTLIATLGTGAFIAGPDTTEY